MYTLSDAEEEILESLWIEINEHKKKPETRVLKDEPAFQGLVQKGLLDVQREELFTAAGMEEAELCVRRHRLAERLLADLFDVQGPLLHEAGCKFEHGLHHGLEDSVCTLLGHPRTCPHSKLIPPGACCRTAEKLTARLVIPLSELEPAATGKITYINTQDQEVLNKLLAMGLLPGKQVRLLHRFPSFVFEMDNSTFAIDSDLASHVHVIVLQQGTKTKRGRMRWRHR